VSAERNDAAPVGPPETPDDSPLTMEEAIALRGPLAAAKLAVGDPAFAFELPLLDAAGDHATGETVRLADHRGVRPIALIFGSYT
jgi:hypothetical protein